MATLSAVGLASGLSTLAEDAVLVSGRGCAGS
jgi:hypothetical protein